jgi:DegV family protein with EDD domain
MHHACFLTDSSVQFTDPTFPGRGLVEVIPFRNHVPLGTSASADIPVAFAANNGGHPFISAPSVDDFLHTWGNILSRHSQDTEIIVILSSSQLSLVVDNARLAADLSQAPVQIIDSGTAGPGLGMLVQDAARSGRQGASAAEVRHMVNERIAHTYTAFCVRSLSYLQRAGQLDPAQAVVGDMLGITTFMLLESGTLVHQHKVHNTHQMMDLFHEFAAEFDHPRHIATLHETNAFGNEIYRLRERLQNSFPKTTVTEHRLGPVLGAILGPSSLGLVVTE